MSEIVTWDALAKAVGDLTTIIEQIASDITDHDTDADAHNTSGSSLYGHRTAEPIDHPDGSVGTATIADEAVTAAKMELQEDWIAPTLLNSWVNYGGGYETVGYMKDSLGFVHLKGLVKTGTIGLKFFTLPVGYRPAAVCIFAVASYALFGDVYVSVTGDVTANVGSSNWVSLAGITFKAEA
jgi:hypothetical protein